MINICTKRHPIKFYFAIIAGTLFFIVMATVLLFVNADAEEAGRLSTKEKLLPLFSIACYAFAVYSLYQYFKNVPIVQIDDCFISFNNQSYLLTDIARVNLTGKRPFRYAISFPMEATSIVFKNGETKFLFDDMYSNAWEVKSFLDQVIVKGKLYVAHSPEPIESNLLASDSYENFKGQVFLSLRGLTQWALIGYLIYSFFIRDSHNSLQTILVLVGIALLWILLHTYFLFYFKVSDNFLVIRNHNLFWNVCAYRLSDIREVVFETQGKMPNCLRVIQKNFRHKIYPAGTLSDKDWLRLRDKLRLHQIKVRNECVH